eukprot:5523132-Prymnesium_polylepis.1
MAQDRGGDASDGGGGTARVGAHQPRSQAVGLSSLAGMSPPPPLSPMGLGHTPPRRLMPGSPPPPAHVSLPAAASEQDGKCHIS